eukprot:763638-Hanusia_phi.AAC.1
MEYLKQQNGLLRMRLRQGEAEAEYSTGNEAKLRCRWARSNIRDPCSLTTAGGKSHGEPTICNKIHNLE